MKPFWKSKTFWANAAMALVGTIPEVSSWVSANPLAASSIMSVLNICLRGVTDKAISFKFSKEF